MPKFFLLLIFIVLLLFNSCGDENSTEQVTQEIKVAVLLQLSGSGPFQEKYDTPVIDIAETDINNYLQNINSNNRIKYVIKDTEYNTSLMIDALQDASQQNIKIVHLSCSSEDLSFIKPIINSLNLIVFNHASTAASLSESDNIIRFIPDDNKTSRVISDMLKYNNIKYLMILYRNDIWGRDLKTGITDSFAVESDTVLVGFDYNTSKLGTDFDTLLNELNDSMTQYSGLYDTTQIAVQLLCFEEGVTLLNKASQYPLLSTVKWYCSDGFTGNEDLLNDSLAVSFAEKAGLYSPIIGELTTDTYTSISNRIAQMAGHKPYLWAPLLYDSLYIAGLLAGNITNENTVDEIKQLLLTTLDSYDGVTGKIDLNTNGDRIDCIYDFWKTYKEDSTYSWKKSYSYDSGSITSY